MTGCDREIGEIGEVGEVGGTGAKVWVPSEAGLRPDVCALIQKVEPLHTYPYILPKKLLAPFGLVVLSCSTMRI